MKGKSLQNIEQNFSVKGLKLKLLTVFLISRKWIHVIFR